MTSAIHRHDINDSEWAVIEPHTIGNKGTWGGNAHDTRLFINAVFWVLRTGAPWRDLPSDYGDWKNTHRRFCRWRDKRIWEKILEALIDEPDFEWLMIDASHIKVHPHAAGAVGGNQDMGKTKGGLIPRYTWPWMRMVCQYDFLLQRAPQRIAQLQGS
jgi:transposase